VLRSSLQPDGKNPAPSKSLRSLYALTIFAGAVHLRPDLPRTILGSVTTLQGPPFPAHGADHNVIRQVRTVTTSDDGAYAAARNCHCTQRQCREAASSSGGHRHQGWQVSVQSGRAMSLSRSVNRSERRSSREELPMVESTDTLGASSNPRLYLVAGEWPRLSEVDLLVPGVTGFGPDSDSPAPWNLP